MITLSVSLVTALVGAVLASIGTYVAARRDLQLKFDDSLRDLRITRYEQLWKELKPLAKYGRPTALSHEQIADLIAAVTTWYFDTGGLVLSSEAREDYFALQDGLEFALARPPDELNADDDEFLRVLASRLRTAMTRDVGTRRTFIFRGDPEREEPPIETAEPCRPEQNTCAPDHSEEPPGDCRRRLWVGRVREEEASLGCGAAEAHC